MDQAEALFTGRAELRSFQQDCTGHRHAPCELDGLHVRAVAGPRTAKWIDQLVERVDSRVDADRTLREAHVAPHPAG